MRRIELFFLYAFLFSLFTLPFERFRVWIGGLCVPICVFFIIVVLFLYSLRLLFNGKTARYPGFLIFGSVGFIISMLLSTLLAGLSFGISGKNLARILEYTFYLSLPFLMVGIMDDLKKVSKAFYIMISVGVAWSIIGHINFFVGGYPDCSIVSHTGKMGTRSSDMFMIEGSLVMALSFLLFFLGKKKTGLKFCYILCFLGAILMTLAVIFGYCRGAWLSIGWGCLFLSVYYFRKKANLFRLGNVLKPVLFLVIMIFLISYFVPEKATIRLKKRFDTLTALNLEQMSRTRYRVLQMSMIIFDDYLLRGVGTGNFEEALKRYDSPKLTSSPFNSYVYILIEQGFLGLVFFLGLLLIPLWRLLSILPKTDDDNKDQWVILSSCGLLIVYMIHLLFDSFSNFIFFWIVYSLCVVTLICAKRELAHKAK